MGNRCRRFGSSELLVFQCAGVDVPVVGRFDSALLASHEFHEACHESAGLIDSAIGHALVETDAALTRLPQPHTVPPVQPSTALRSYSSNVLVLPGDQVGDAIDRFVTARISGGASCDALIAVTANRHSATLLTRDERAADVYERFGTDVRWVST